MEFLPSLWAVFAQMAPWLLFGFLTAGVVSALMAFHLVGKAGAKWQRLRHAGPQGGCRK